jgi:hypothetical protein
VPEVVLNYEEWLETVPEEITGDLLWKMKRLQSKLWQGYVLI